MNIVQNIKQEIETHKMMISEYRDELRLLREKSVPGKKGCKEARKRELLVYKLLALYQKDLCELLETK